MSSKNPKARTVGQIAGAIFKWLLVSLVSVMALAFLTESYFKGQNAKHYPPPGQLYQVGEHKMHIWCEGSGEPTIVLDSGASMFSSGWRWVMPELSSSTRVCAFDRSGLGWSEVSRPPYDGINAAHELNELLQQAGVQSPFIYVGHSLGANLGGIYHQQYPHDLNALIMLEPANPEIFLQELGEDRGTAVVRGAPISDCGMRCVMVALASSLGVIDIALEQIEAVNDPLYHAQALAEFKARTNRTQTLQFLAQRGKYITEIIFQSADSREYGDLPVAIFHSENAGELLGDTTDPQQMIEDREKGVLAYEDALTLSSQPLGLTEITQANHLTMVMHEEPAKQVSGRVLEILQQLRE
jgi:pimeloyl-ACP methyl ester carboxylesterase